MGLVSTAGDISTNGDAVTFTAGVSLTGDVAIGTAGGKLWFKDVLDGDQLLTITAGAGDVQFDKAVGGLTPLSGLSIVSSAKVDINDILKADDQNIDINATGAVGLDQALTTTHGGTVTITNGGLLTIADLADLTLDGAFLQDGVGLVSTAGDISTSGDAVTFTAGVSLTGDVAIGTAGGKLWFKDVLDGDQLLTITAGAGDVQFDKAVGGLTPLSGLSIVSSAKVDINDILKADDQNIDINATGAVGLDQALTTTHGGTVTITNGGLLTIADLADLTLDGAFLQDGVGLVSTAGDISTNGDAVTFTAGVSLTGDVAIGTAGGKLWFKDVLDGDQLLTITAGAGDVQFDKAVGGLTPLSGLSIVSSAKVDINDILKADDQNIDINATGAVGLDQALTTTHGGTVTITNGGLLTIADLADLTLDGAFLQDGVGLVSTAGDISTSGDAVTFTAGVSLTGDVAIGTAGGKLWFKDVLDGDQLLTITAGAGDVQFDKAVGGLTPLGGLSIVSSAKVDINDILKADDQNIDINATGAVGLDQAITTTHGGTVTITNGSLLTIADLADLTLDGAFLQDGVGLVSTAGDISTSGDAVTFTAGVSLTGDVAIGTAGGKLWFKDVLDGDQLLTITAGAGDVQFDKAVGGLTPLSGLSIVSSAKVDINDILKADDQNIDINATGAVGLDQALTITHGGTVTITNGGLLTIADLADLTLDGAFLQDGVGLVSTAGDISTSGDAVTFTAGVSLTGDVAIGTAGGKLWFKDVLDGDQLLTITAGAGDVQFDKAVGGLTPLSGLSIVSSAKVDINDILKADDQNIDINATGAVGLDQAITTTHGGTVTITNGSLLTIADLADLTLDGAFLQDGVGLVSTAGDISTSGDAVTFTAGVSLTGDVAIGTAGGKLWFKDVLDGDQLLTITAGAGDVQFDKAVGGLTPLSGLSIVSSAKVDINDILKADDQNIDINATGAVGLDQAITTTHGGTVTITNGGLLTIADLADLTLDGAFLQDGVGLVSTAGDISTNGDAVTFTAGVSLTGDVAIGTAGGKLWFKDVLDGDQLLTITAGAGDVQFDKAVGGLTPLSGLSIVSSAKVDINDILKADDQNIDINATGAVGLDQALTTTHGGTVTITNGGLLTIADLADLTLDGAFLQDGVGLVSTAGDISTSGDAVTFTAGVSLTGDVAIGTAGGKLWFKDVLDGDQLLTITAGAGDVQFDKAVGGLTPLSGLSIVSSAKVDINDILKADDQNIDINATGAVGLDQALTTTHGGTVTITNGGLLTIADLADLTLDGAFLQDGVGLVSTAGDISTNGDAVTFTAGVSLTGDVAIGTAGGKLWFKDVLDGDQLLTITAGAGDVQFDKAVGGLTPLSGLSIVSSAKVDINDILKADDQNIDINATGAVGLDQALTTTHGGTVTITNGGLLTIADLADLTLDGAFLQDGVGLVSTAGDISTSGDAVTFTAGVSLTGDVAIGTAGGKLWFKDVLDGDQLLTITAGAGDVQFDKAVGGLTPLGGLSIVSSAKVDINDILKADDQNIDINATGAVGLDQAITTTHGGTVTITNGSLLTIADLADLTLDGARSAIVSRPPLVIVTVPP